MANVAVVKGPFDELLEAWPRKLILLAIVAVVVAFPAMATELNASRFTTAVVFAIIGLSVNILMGYAGQISLGHQAFVGVGAFSAAYLATNSGLPIYLAIPLAGVIGGAISAILGLVALRIQGLYLALITLAYGAVAERSIFSIQALTGGGAGIPALRPEPFVKDNTYSYFCLLVLVLVLFFDWRMMRTKFGRALLALKSNEQVAASFGMNPVFYKVGAFVVAGIVAGIGGGLYAFKEQHVVSADFTFALALTFVIMTVIGGLGNRIGVVLGSAFTAYIPVILNSVARWFDAQWVIPYRLLFTALLLLLTLTQFPGGIAQQLHPFTEWLVGKPFHLPHKKKGKGKHKGKAATTVDIADESDPEETH